MYSAYFTSETIIICIEFKVERKKERKKELTISCSIRGKNKEQPNGTC